MTISGVEPPAYTDQLCYFVMSDDWSQKAQRVREALERADQEFITATKEFDAIAPDIPSRILHPYGDLRITQAGERRMRALEEYRRALRAYHEH